jgi:hypothetical protein
MPILSAGDDCQSLNIWLARHLQGRPCNRAWTIGNDLPAHAGRHMLARIEPLTLLIV